MTSALMIIDTALAIQQATNYRIVVSELRAKVLRRDVDYGVIPGTNNKEVLFKPGAERLCSAFGFAPDFQLVKSIENWDTIPPLFHYQYCCRLIHIDSGRTIASGIGSCNSMESKYRWRKAERVCPKCGKANIRHSKEGGWYCWRKTDGCGETFAEGDPVITSQNVGKIENPDIFDLVNTIDKMAQKRALIAASLIGCNASEFFTQDVEDFTRKDDDVVEGEVVDEPPADNPNHRPAEEPRQRSERAAAIHWSVDPAKAPIVLAKIVEEFSSVGVKDMADAELMVGKSASEFPEAKQFHIALKKAVKAMADKEPAKPKQWWTDKIQMEPVERLLSPFQMDLRMALTKMAVAIESIKSVSDLMVAIRSKAIEEHWPIVVNQCRVVTSALSEVRVLHFDTPLGGFEWYSRHKLLEAVADKTTVDWIGVDSWKDGEHQMPEPIRLIWGFVDKQGTPEYKIESIEVVADVLF